MRVFPFPCSVSESELSEEDDEDEEEEEDEDEEEEQELLLLSAFLLASLPFTALSFLTRCSGGCRAVGGGDCFLFGPCVDCLASGWLLAGDLLLEVASGRLESDAGPRLSEGGAWAESLEGTFCSLSSFLSPS